MKKKYLFLFIMLCLIPGIVYAEESFSDAFPLGMAIFMEAFVTIHMTVFVLIPISNMLGGNNSKQLLKILFIGRILILLFCDFFITTAIALVDFLAVFIGAFLVVPICAAITHKSPFDFNVKVTKTGKNHYKETIKVNKDSRMEQKNRNVVMRCSYCGRISPFNSSTCDGCGASFTEKDIIQDWYENK